MVRGSLSDDLVHVAADLVARPAALPAGQDRRGAVVVAVLLPVDLGVRAASALRVLQSMLGHLRLDVDAETVADAEFDALHAP
jgi:hypothetical protein